MNLRALTYSDTTHLTTSQLHLGQQILNLMHDLGMARDIVLALDEPEDPDTEFCIYFVGSSLFLHYTYEGIIVERISDDDTIPDETLKIFALNRTNEAVHWLLTQGS